jgi:hypothetical protein
MVPCQQELGLKDCENCAAVDFMIPMVFRIVGLAM